MNLLNRLTINNLKLNKKRTIVTIIGIILSVALITAVTTMYSSLLSSLIKYETQVKGNFHAVFSDVPVEDINVFQNNRDIKDFYIVKNIGYANLENSQNTYKPYAYLKALNQEALANLSINLVEGRFPENENEILIPTHLKTNGRITWHVGDEITLDVGTRVALDGYLLDQSNPLQYDEASKEKSETIINTTAKTYKIVGIMERVASNLESYTAPGYTFITYSDSIPTDGVVDIYAKYTKKGAKSAYEVTADILGVDRQIYKKWQEGDLSYAEFDENDDIEAAYQELAKVKYDADINSYLITLENNPLSAIEGLDIVIAIVCLIIIVTSVFCIKNSFDISITEKQRQYGMLKSVGATKKQIKKNVFYEASILGIIGIPLGLILGLIASVLLIIISNYYLNDSLATGIKLIFSIRLPFLLTAVVLGILTIYLSAFKSAKRASVISPIESIRNSANIKIKAKSLRTPKIISKVFGIGGEISYKNLKRNKKKYRTTILSIIVSVSVFIALSSFMSLAFSTVESELNISEYNVYTSIRNITDNSYANVLATTKLDNINNFAIVRYLGYNVLNVKMNEEYLNYFKLDPSKERNAYFNIVALGEDQYQKYLKSFGLDYETMKNKAILVDFEHISVKRPDEGIDVDKYMSIYDYQAGDVITGTLDYGESYSDLEIGYVTTTAPFGLKNKSANQELIVSDELFESLGTSKVLEVFYDASDADKLQDEIETILQDEDYQLDNIEENVRMMKNLFILVAIFLYGFIIVISLIGITNIFNTITTNMELRKREFAMLKSIGMTSKEFKAMIRLESLFMGMKSLIFGIPIGVGLSLIIYHFLVPDREFAYQLPVLAIILAIAAVFLLITTLMKYSLNKINKQNTIETIRNENI